MPLIIGINNFKDIRREVVELKENILTDRLILYLDDQKKKSKMEIRFDGDKDFVERTEEAQKEKMRKMVRYRVIRVTNQWHSMRPIKRKNHVTTDQSETHDGEAHLISPNQELNSKIRDHQNLSASLYQQITRTQIARAHFLCFFIS